MRYLAAVLGVLVLAGLPQSAVANGSVAGDATVLRMCIGAANYARDIGRASRQSNSGDEAGARLARIRLNYSSRYDDILTYPHVGGTGGTVFFQSAGVALQQRITDANDCILEGKCTVGISQRLIGLANDLQAACVTDYKGEQ